MAISPKTCVVCGKTYVPRSWNSKMTPQCSPACKEKLRAARRKKVTAPCKQCGKMVMLQGRKGLEQARIGAIYCSDACKRTWTSERSRKTMVKLNRRTASQRMKERNPMHDTDTRAKVSATLRSMGWGPTQRGGNGRGPTEPQKTLSEVLGWPTEVVVCTKMPRGSGYPTNYKLDIGEPELMVGIEIDGSSHCSRKRQEQDAKKEEFLTSLGWTVLRFTNAEVMDDLAGCVRTVVSTTWRSTGTTTTSPMAS